MSRRLAPLISASLAVVFALVAVAHARGATSASDWEGGHGAPPSGPPGGRAAGGREKRSCAFFSIRRYSGMLIVHGRVKTFG